MEDRFLLAVTCMLLATLRGSEITCSAAEDSGTDFIVSITSTHSTVNTGQDFDFECSTTGIEEMVVFAVFVQNHPNSTIPKRLTTQYISSNVIRFHLAHIQPSDNGAELVCKGVTTTSGKSGVSPSLTLNVHYPPTFEEGANNTISMCNMSADCQLKFTVVPGNPSENTTIHLSSTASNLSNVINVTSIHNSSFTISKASLENKGNYSGTVSNDVGSTTLSYITFIGGPPIATFFSITCKQAETKTEFSISCDVIDRNSAPATMLQFSLPVLQLNRTFSCDDVECIPVNKSFLPSLTVSLDFINPGNYSLNVLAANDLGCNIVHSQNFYIDGLNQNITIKPYGNFTTQQTLGLSENFMFVCSASETDAVMELLILGPGNETKLEKVSQNKTDLGTIFTYNITDYADDQTTFRCRYQMWISPDLVLTVFYGPVYNNASCLSGNNDTEVKVTVSLIANPPVTTHFQWLLNNKPISDSNRISITPEEIHFNPLYVSDTGMYAVIGCNNISCGNHTFDFEVYFRPVFSGNRINFTELIEIATGTSRNLTCAVIAESGLDSLNITLSTEPRLEDITTTSSNTSITVMIADASMSDVAKYQCQACYGDYNNFCSFYWFDSYVGGPPDNVTIENIVVRITVAQQGETVVSIWSQVTDSSTVPMTGVNFVINQTTFNYTVVINAPLKGQTQEISTNFTVATGGVLDTKNNVTMDIFAVNMLGSTFVKSVSVGTNPNDSLSLWIIVAAVVGPVCLLALLFIIIVCCCTCYRRRKRLRGFTLVNIQDD